MADVWQAFSDFFHPSVRAKVLRASPSLDCIAPMAHRLQVLYRVRTALAYRNDMVFRQIKVCPPALHTSAAARINKGRPLFLGVASFFSRFGQPFRSCSCICRLAVCCAPLLESIFFCDFATPFRTRRPGVVILPVVHGKRPFVAVDKPDIDQRLDERAFLSWPVNAQLDVLCRERR